MELFLACAASNLRELEIDQHIYTHYDEHGTDTMGRYQDPRASMGHLISNFLPDGTLSALTFSRGRLIPCPADADVCFKY